MAGFQQGDGIAAIGESHGDAAAHRAGADDADAGDLALDDVLAGNLCRLTFGEEQVALGARLVAGDELDEQRALRRQRLVEGQRDGIAHRLRTGDRRFEAARLPGKIRCLGVEGRQVGFPKPLIAIAHRREGTTHAGYFPGEVHRMRGQIAFEDGIDETRGMRLGRTDRRTGNDHLERLHRADKTRQPHRAAAARQQAELHLGKAELGAGIGDAEMAAERQFQPAAERRAVDGGDRRLGDGLERRKDGAQFRLLHRFAEFGDVGASDKSPAGAGDDNSRDRSIIAQGDQSLHQRFADMKTQRVDRRVVDDDDGDIAVPIELQEIGHAKPPSNGERPWPRERVYSAMTRMGTGRRPGITTTVLEQPSAGRQPPQP